jgi:hypothetical protein
LTEERLFRESDWLDRNLADVGVSIFTAGAGFFALLALVQLLELAVGEVTAWVTFWSVARAVAGALAEPLMFNGVVLYLFGLVASRWKVAIVGFEYKRNSDLRLRGPDDTHTVWLGRGYASSLEAAAAADAIHSRGASKRT